MWEDTTPEASPEPEHRLAGSYPGCPIDHRDRRILIEKGTVVQCLKCMKLFPFDSGHGPEWVHLDWKTTPSYYTVHTLQSEVMEQFQQSTEIGPAPQSFNGLGTGGVVGIAAGTNIGGELPPPTPPTPDLIFDWDSHNPTVEHGGW